MRYCFIFILAFIFSPFISTAQIGWQWGVSSAPGNNAGIETWTATVDDSGNVLSSGLVGNPTLYSVYGVDTLYNIGHNDQLILIKSDSNGNFLWVKGTQDANTWAYGVATDHSGNVYLLGSYYDSSICLFGTDTLYNPSNFCMYFLTKYSPTGNVIWAKNIVGNSRLRFLGAIGVDGAGNIYVSGGFNDSSVSIGGTTLVNMGSFDVFVAKYDTLGNPVWAKSFGGIYDDFPQLMTVTPAGNIYISGPYFSSSMVIGIDTLTYTLSSGTYLPPMTFFAKFDSSGNTIWAKELNPKLTINGLACDALENIYMVGSMDSNVILGYDTLIDEGATDVFLAKYDSSGHVKWANSAGGPYSDNGWGITVDNCYNVWIAGGTSSTTSSINFNGFSLTTSYGYRDPAFVAEYSTDSGIYENSMAVTSGGDDYVFVLSNKRGSFYLVGDYVNSSPLVFGPDTLLSYSTAEEALFIAKYKYDTSGCTLDTSYTHSDTVVCASSDNFMITLAAPPGTNYFWYDGTTASTHIENSGGIYWVSYISGTNFIIDTFHVTFTLNSPPCHPIAGINQTLAGSPNDVEIYPNPATNELTIEMIMGAYNSLTVTNSIGQQFIQQQINTAQTTVNINMLSAGIYFITLRGENGAKVVKFIVRQNQ